MALPERPHDFRLFSNPEDRSPAVENPDTVFAPGEATPEPVDAAQPDGRTRPFAVFRAFSFISFVAIAIAAALLAMAYRYISIQGITEESEAGNVLIAQAAIGATHEQLAGFLAQPNHEAVRFPPQIAESLRELTKDTRVRKVKVYSDQGDVVFSTTAGEPGERQIDNPWVVRALAGGITSRLVYRDTFNRFDGGRAEDNLIQTYLPLQVNHLGRTVGVFAISTDVNTMVKDNEQAQVIIVATAVLIMVLLYVSLLAIVRRIEKVIDLQQDALRERSDLLAALSARMLNVQESEKRRIAAELHERVAQTLSAVKLNVETALSTVRRGNGDPAPLLEAMVPALQAATQDVRAVAVGLRPSSLDDLGLLATMRWVCREFVEKYPHVDLETRFDVQEEQIPVPLRSILYRVVEDCFAALAANEAVGRVALSLAADPDKFSLSIRDDALRGDVPDENHPYARARERTLLSGGKFTVRSNSWGGLALRATWFR